MHAWGPGGERSSQGDSFTRPLASLRAAAKALRTVVRPSLSGQRCFVGCRGTHSTSETSVTTFSRLLQVQLPFLSRRAALKQDCRAANCMQSVMPGNLWWQHNCRFGRAQLNISFGPLPQVWLSNWTHCECLCECSQLLGPDVSLFGGGPASAWAGRPLWNSASVCARHRFSASSRADKEEKLSLRPFLVGLLCLLFFTAAVSHLQQQC